MKPVLECVEVQKRFPVNKKQMLHAVEDVTFSIGDGKSVELVGASG